MEPQITARHFDASPALRDYASKQLSKLNRYYDGIVDAHIILSQDGDHHQSKGAEITLNVYRQRLCANNTAPTHEAAIDNCVENLRRQVLKYKDKLRSTDQDYHR